MRELLDLWLVLMAPPKSYGHPTRFGDFGSNRLILLGIKMDIA